MVKIKEKGEEKERPVKVKSNLSLWRIAPYETFILHSQVPRGGFASIYSTAW